MFEHGYNQICGHSTHAFRLMSISSQISASVFRPDMELVKLTCSKSCLPVVTDWMANSSSASIVVTRTLTYARANILEGPNWVKCREGTVCQPAEGNATTPRHAQINTAAEVFIPFYVKYVKYMSWYRASWSRPTIVTWIFSGNALQEMLCF